VRTAKEYAGSLRVIADLWPGLLPETAIGAADLLEDQDRELTSLRAALAAKHHHVAAKITRFNDYRATIRADFTITDPVQYYGEIITDAYRLGDRDFTIHLARDLTRNSTAQWVRDMEGKAARAIFAAIDSDRGSLALEGRNK